MRAPSARVRMPLVGAAFAAAALYAPQASAELHLSIGSRFEPFRYTSPYFPNTGGSGVAPISANTKGFQTTSLSPYFGLFFAQRYGVLLALDIGYAKSFADSQANMAPMATEENNGYFQFGFSAGFKGYLSPIKSGRVAPYIYVDFFKYFATVTTDNMAVSGEKATAQANLMSPIGASLAVGAEYFLSPAFSIGSEIFGLRVSNVSGEYRDASMTRFSQSYTQVSLYTGITLNFRFQVQAAVRSEDDGNKDDEKERSEPPRRRQREDAPQPILPPAPTPEAVD